MIDSFTGKYKFLSNFYEHDFYEGDLLYKSVEHYYQSKKAIDFSEFRFIQDQPTPALAKRAGRQCKIKSNWDKIKVEVMFNGLLLKFANKEFENKLIETDYKILIEGNYWHDNFWGNCTCSKCKNIIGLNKLGKLLMFIRWIKQ